MQIVSDLETATRAITPDEGDNDLEGYYCIQTVPFKCGCRTKLWTFIHFEKKIIVWVEKDHPGILSTASEFKKINLDPKIVEYKVMMGKAVDWDTIPSEAVIG